MRATSSDLKEEAMVPKITEFRALKVIGVGGTFTPETRSNIPQLWGQFIPRLGEVVGTASRVTYGVCFPANEAGEFEYIAAIEVAEDSSVPEGMAARGIPAQRYAVFRHNVSSANLHEDLQPTIDFIWGDWIKTSGYTHVAAPDFELYSDDFDPSAAGAWIDIYVPIE